MLPMGACARRNVLAAALVLTALNAAKPLVIDDAAYVFIARQIAAHPLDPYGFDLFWYQMPSPAHLILAPPVLPAWLALGITLFGERPLLWKLSLFPYALCLSASVWALLRRLAPGLERPLLWMAVLSPTVLPGFNLMLDVPALALAYGGVVLLLRAVDGGGSALAAGLVAGIAMQTKYTAVVPFVAALGYAALGRRFGVALRAGGAAALVFVGWETLIEWRYSLSQFIGWFVGPLRHQLPDPELPDLVLLLGSLLPPAALLGLVALGAPRRVTLAAMGLATAAFGVVPLLPDDLPERLGMPLSPLLPEVSAALLFAPLGLLVALALVAAAAALAWRPLREGRRLASDPQLRLDALAVGWLVLETAGFFVLSPYPAARRLVGLGSVAILTLGRLAAQRRGLDRRMVTWVAAWGVALGALYWGSDTADAWTERAAVARGAAEVRRQARARGEEPPRIWFVGHWSFQFYAQERGMLPVVPGRSRLEPGDWLLVPVGVHKQLIEYDSEALQRVSTLGLPSVSPWSTLPHAYDGSVPLRRQARPHLRLRVFRVRRPFIPETPPKESPEPPSGWLPPFARPIL